MENAAPPIGRMFVVGGTAFVFSKYKVVKRVVNKCRRRDSNPQSLRNYALNVAWIPVSPLRQNFLFSRASESIATKKWTVNEAMRGLMNSLFDEKFAVIISPILWMK